MSTMKVNSITDAAGTGAPDFTYGMKLGSGSTISAYSEGVLNSNWYNVAAPGETSGALSPAAYYRVIGKAVHVFFAYFRINLGTGGDIRLNDAFPVGVRPSMVMDYSALLGANGGSTIDTIRMAVNTSGVVTIYSNVSGSSFSTGNGGLCSSAGTHLCVSWML